jgi:hypothetical protein
MVRQSVFIRRANLEIKKSLEPFKRFLAANFLTKNNKKMKNLEAGFSNQKSFYGKAKTKIMDGEIKLLSYGTHVASVISSEKGLKLELRGYYSRTTAKHIREFAMQHGFNCPTKEQMINY